MNNEIINRKININNFDINLYISGPDDGELIILLHGFPQDALVWKNQLQFLARKGFHVWAPDQRGYGSSGKSADIRDYKPEALVNDIYELINQSKFSKASIVGHGYGAVIAWWLADWHPEIVAGIVAINAPHNDALIEFTKKHPGQIFKSWYMFLLALPVFPDWLLSRNRFSLLKRILTKTSSAGTFQDYDLEDLEKSWSNDNSLSRMINWYRAAFRYPFKTTKNKILVKSSMIWGEQDQFSPIETAEMSEKYCKFHCNTHYLKDIGHWAINEDPETISHLIAEEVNYFSRPEKN